MTRERILQAACDAFIASWYDDVTLRDVAAAADVALQTLVNHFGTKEALFGAAAERIGDAIQAGRYDVEPGDLEGAVAALVDDYDRTGDFTLRTLAEEERLAVVRPGLARGRRGHQDWVEHVFRRRAHGPARRGPKAARGPARRRHRRLHLEAAPPRQGAQPRPDHHRRPRARGGTAHLTRRRLQMTDLLMTTWDGGGTTPPLMSVARALVARGHRLRVLADPVLRADVEATGAEFVSWTRAPHRLERSYGDHFVRDWGVDPAEGFARMRDRLALGPAAAYAADVREELERRPAAALLTELLLFGPQVAAEAAGIPCIVLNPTINVVPAPGVPPFGSA